VYSLIYIYIYIYIYIFSVILCIDPGFTVFSEINSLTSPWAMKGRNSNQNLYARGMSRGVRIFRILK
jgi:hypothetical protein